MVCRVCQSLRVKGQIKEMCLRCFLKVATEMAEWTDSGRLFQRGVTWVKRSCTCVGLLTLGSDRLIPLIDLWTGSEWWGKHTVKINRLFFMKHLAGQQTDLEQYSKFYWQPMEGTKQWNAANKWRVLCHQEGQSILNTLEALRGQCRRYHATVNCNNWDD